ncbi:MAG: hypothetical protein IPI28_00800 [Candidatus Omnitrophica bacterium]|nr:hypothetical protein [Candidatus Omnitrophota bacterium]
MIDHLAIHQAVNLPADQVIQPQLALLPHHTVSLRSRRLGCRGIHFNKQPQVQTLAADRFRFVTAFPAFMDGGDLDPVDTIPKPRKKFPEIS